MNLTDKMVARLRGSAHGSLGDRFEIAEEAGSGGMGIVYRAKDRESGRQVALKVLRGHGSTVERFEREAVVLERLDHPAIVDYVAHGVTDDGEPWLAMEWLDGVSLSDRLHSEEPAIPLAEVVQCSIAVAGALAAAHDSGIVHRDLKPSNLFLVDSRLDTPKVLDFGVARFRGTTGESDLTRTGEAIGTPGYMAPEQIRGAKDADERADLFSLGCVIYRMATGRPAFEGDDVLSVIAKLALQPPEPLEELVPDAPPALADLVRRLMSKSPDDRPQSARVVAEALEKIAAIGVTANATIRTISKPPDPEGPTELAGVRPRARSKSEQRTFTAAGSRDDVAPASTMPSSSEWREQIARPKKRIVAGVLGVIAVTGIASVVAWRQSTKSASDPNTPIASASASPSVVVPPPSAAPTTAPSAIDPSAEARADGLLACRAWSDVLARGQKSDGSFAMEPHRKSSGWDTGQQLTGLAAANPRCENGGKLSIASGVSAIGALRHDGGWSGPGSPEKQVDAGSASWVVLALVWSRAAMARDGSSSDLARVDATLKDAEKSLLGFQRPDGTFRFVPAPDKSNDYLSVLGTWALVEAAILDPKLAGPRDLGLKQLREHLAISTDKVRTTSGLTEQALWVLLRARRITQDRPEGDDALITTVAHDVVARCALGPPPESACARPMNEAGTVALEVEKSEPANIATFWHPWMTLASSALIDEPVIQRDASLSRDLSLMTRHGAREFGSGIKALEAAPTYKLSEYLFAAALLTDARQ